MGHHYRVRTVIGFLGGSKPYNALQLKKGCLGIKLKHQGDFCNALTHEAPAPLTICCCLLGEVSMFYFFVWRASQDSGAAASGP